jgi:hypothetical protein
VKAAPAAARRASARVRDATPKAMMTSSAIAIAKREMITHRQQKTGHARAHVTSHKQKKV